MAARTRTATQLLASARQKANRERDDPINGFVSDAEGLGYIREAAQNLWGFLVQAYGTDYFWTQYAVTVPSAANSGPGSYFDLPGDFFKFRGLDLNLDTNRAIPLRPFRQFDRDRFRSNPIIVWFGVAYKYRVEGSQIHLIPGCSGNTQFTLFYTPNCWFMEYGGAQVLQPTFSADGSGNLLVTAANHLIRTGQPLRWTPEPGLLTGALPTGLRSDTDYYALLVDGDSFNLCASQSNALGQGGVTPVPITYTDAGTGQSQADCVFDGVNGWEQYIVLDAAVKMLDKEESDSMKLTQEREKLEDSLRMMAEDRDASFPSEVQDVFRDEWNVNPSGAIY